jgi:uroporphyrinogen decarboxylase
MKTIEKFGFQDIPYIGYGAIGCWEFGGEMKWPSGEFAQAPSVVKYPVQTEEDVWRLKVPTVETAGVVPIMTEINKLVAESGSSYIMGTVQGPFTAAANICGVDRFAKWLLKKPDAVHHLLQLATDFLADWAKYWANAFGPERIITIKSEPTASNQLISPKQFEKFALPYIQELQERILALGIKHTHMHICGEHNLNLPYWAQIPYGSPGIVSFGHEVELETASKYFPDTIIMGNIDPAIIQLGAPQEVYEQSKLCIEKGRKHPGGFILSPGCELPPMSPEENVWAVMQAVSDFGWYE